jgi:hypothetical protein
LKYILEDLQTKVVKKVLDKVYSNDYNLYKKYSNYSPILSLERTLTTILGLTLQEIAEKCSKNLKVVNTDKEEKLLGIDLRVFDGDVIWEGQLKSDSNTQTGTYLNDALTKISESTSKNQTKPFFATAFADSHDYIKDGIRYIGGESFWGWIGVNYRELELRVGKTIVECENEVLTKAQYLKNKEQITIPDEFENYEEKKSEKFW